MYEPNEGIEPPDVPSDVLTTSVYTTGGRNLPEDFGTLVLKLYP